MCRIYIFVQQKSMNEGEKTVEVDNNREKSDWIKKTKYKHTRIDIDNAKHSSFICDRRRFFFLLFLIPFRNCNAERLWHF